MSYKSWNTVYDTVGLPDTVDGLNSRPFSVPHGAKVVTVIVPSLVGAASTLKLQTLTPPISDDATEVWTDTGVFDLTDGTREALDAIPEELATTLPVTALGAGVHRFVASVAQTGAVDAITIYLVWGLDN